MGRDCGPEADETHQHTSPPPLRTPLCPLTLIFSPWSTWSCHLLPHFSATLAFTLLPTPGLSYPVLSSSPFLSLISPVPHLAFLPSPPKSLLSSSFGGSPFSPLHVLVSFWPLFTLHTFPVSPHHPSLSNIMWVSERSALFTGHHICYRNQWVQGCLLCWAPLLLSGRGLL